MSYLSKALSVFSGRPLELFRFACGETVYAYCASMEIEHAGQAYSILPVKREDISDSGETAKQSLTVRILRDSEVAQLFWATGDPLVTLTIFQKQYGDDEVLVAWKGLVSAVGYEAAECVLTAESDAASMRRQSRCRYTRLCGRVHYWSDCGLNKSDWAESATVTAINGKVVTVSLSTARDDTWFSAGMIEYGTALYFIYGHSGNNLTLMVNPRGLNVGDAVTLYPGCDRTRETCKSKFNNLLNCSAFAQIPSENPFKISLA